jgi:chromosome segregation ATPase
MEDLSLWMLISAGGAIGLLGVFLSASERELKKTRREVEGLVAQLEAAPKIITLDNPVEPQPMEVIAPTGLTAQDQHLRDQIASLTGELETSRRAAEELRSQRDHLKNSHSEMFDLRASQQQLEAEITHLKSQLQSAESRTSAAMGEERDAANDKLRLQGEIDDLRSQLETSRAQVEELETARRRLADFESRETIYWDEQKNAEAQIAALRQELVAAKERVQELHAMQNRVAELERVYEESKNKNAQLEEERSRWQERVASGDDQRRRSAMLRELMDALQKTQVALIEKHRQFQDDLFTAARLLEVTPDGMAEGSAPTAIQTHLFPFMAESPRGVGSRDNGGNNDEVYLGDGPVDEGTEVNGAIPANGESSAATAPKRKRRFGIFPA